MCGGHARDDVLEAGPGKVPDRRERVTVRAASGSKLATVKRDGDLLARLSAASRSGSSDVVGRFGVRDALKL